MFITWSSEYETGVPAVDRDHKILVDLINQVDALVAEGGGPDAVGEVVERLTDYVAEHFAREERLMEEAGFAGAAAHMARHEDFTHRVGSLAREYEFDPESVDMREVLDFLADWLVNHILKADKAFADDVKRWITENEEAAARLAAS